MTIRVRYYLNSDDDSKNQSFNTEKEASDWWENRYGYPLPLEKLIKVETDVQALEKSVEENRKHKYE